MGEYFKTEGLSVGYNGRILIDDINIALEEGKILTLIGPNGAGKSTILKTVTKQLEKIGGSVYIGGCELYSMQPKMLAQNMAVVLTDRIRPELMTCAEVVAMGRYPYTNMFGKLTREDEKAVNDALAMVHALELARQDFMTLSDGQRQRIMLARAICQEPKILVLDEPTAYLDIRYKVELLEILQELARTKKATIVMSLHEIDLALKASDYIICVGDNKITAFGTPEDVVREMSIEKLYGMETGSFRKWFPHLLSDYE
jgi:iron complex transport system ATP-binding protein